MIVQRGAVVGCVLLATAWAGIGSNPGRAEVAPGSDAASEYVKKLGCDQVKALAQASAQVAMQEWADRFVVGASKDRVYGILARGARPLVAVAKTSR